MHANTKYTICFCHVTIKEECRMQLEKLNKLKHFETIAFLFEAKGH